MTVEDRETIWSRGRGAGRTIGRQTVAHRRTCVGGSTDSRTNRWPDVRGRGGREHLAICSFVNRSIPRHMSSGGRRFVLRLYGPRRGHATRLSSDLRQSWPTGWSKSRVCPRRARPAPYTRLVKLVVAVVHNEDARSLIDALLAAEYRATWLHSTGGFLKQSNATILLGVDEAKVEEVVALVRQQCHSRTQTVSPMMPIMEPGEFFMPYPLEVEVGGAVVFVVPVDRFERI